MFVTLHCYYMTVDGWIMGYSCRLGWLGNSSTASGCSNHWETVGPSYSLAVGTFFFRAALLLSILAALFLPFSSSFVSLSYFILAVLMRYCLGRH